MKKYETIMIIERNKRATVLNFLTGIESLFYFEMGEFLSLPSLINHYNELGYFVCAVDHNAVEQAVFLAREYL